MAVLLHTRLRALLTSCACSVRSAKLNTHARTLACTPVQLTRARPLHRPHRPTKQTRVPEQSRPIDPSSRARARALANPDPGARGRRRNKIYNNESAALCAVIVIRAPNPPMHARTRDLYTRACTQKKTSHTCATAAAAAEATATSSRTGRAFALGKVTRRSVYTILIFLFRNVVCSICVPIIVANRMCQLLLVCSRRCVCGSYTNCADSGNFDCGSNVIAYAYETGRNQIIIMLNATN